MEKRPRGRAVSASDFGSLGTRVRIPLEARFFPNLNCASLHRAFPVHPFIGSKWLKYCWRDVILTHPSILSHGGSTWNLASVGPMASEKIFENTHTHILAHQNTTAESCSRWIWTAGGGGGGCFEGKELYYWVGGFSFFFFFFFFFSVLWAELAFVKM